MKELQSFMPPAKYRWMVIVGVVIIAIIIFFPDLIKNLISGIIKGIGGGVQSGINDVLQTPVSQDNKDAMAWLDNWGKQHPDGSFLSSQLYDNNPGDVSIDASTAQNLWNNVKDGVGWFTNDMSSLQGQFNAVVGSQTDISYVASLCMQDKNKTLGDYMYSNFYSYQPVILKNFIQWASSLPIN
jgi:hypothetical protein